MSAVLLDGLLRASLEGALLVALVALVVRALPALPAGVRSTLWWAACLKLLVAFAWFSPLELPVLPAAASERAAVETAAPRIPAPDAAAGAAFTPAGESAAGAAAAVTPPASFGARFPSLLPALLAWLWFAGAAAGLAALGVEIVRLRRRVRRARPVADPGLLARLDRLAARLGVRPPRLLVSAEVESPQVIGLVRPALLLPAAAAGDRRFAGPALDLALGHELAHLRRRDLLLGWVPALAARLFFFHPLAALAAREYALAREAACDADVLDALGTPPHDYGRMLLTWGVAGTPGGGHRGLLAAALGDRRQLKRRLLMLEQTTRNRGRLRPWTAILVALAVVACLASVRLTAAPGGDSEPTLTPATPAVALPALTPPTPQTPPVAPVAPVRLAHAAGDGDGHHDERHHRTSWSWNSDGGDPFVIVDGDERKVFHGSSGDADRAERLRRGDEALIWFVRDGREHVIRDPAVLRQVLAALQPVEDLGERMGEIGAEMGKVGGHQGEWGAKQAAVGAEMSRIGAEMGRLGAELGSVVSERVAAEMADADEATIDELERRSERIEAEMEALEEQMEAQGEQMDAFGEEMDAHGEEMDAWGEKMDALGEQMEEAVEKAMEEIDRTLDKALADGRAEAVR